MRIAHIENNSSTYGIKGNAFTIWTQGCSLNCKGCWNTQMHDFNGGVEMSIEEIVQRLQEANQKYGVTTVTILGGEPLQQQDIFNLMARIVDLEDNKYGIILYTGYTKKEIKDLGYSRYVRLADVLISGRYDESKRDITKHLIGSTNQEIDFFTNKFKKSDIKDGTRFELKIKKTGETTGLGYPDDFFDIL